MGYAHESDRQREFDAAVIRMRPALQSMQKAREKALLLPDLFTTRNLHKKVLDAVVSIIITSDNHVASWESTLLSELRLKNRL